MKKTGAILFSLIALSLMVVTAQAQNNSVEFMVSIDRVIPPEEVPEAELELSMAVQRGDARCQASTEVVDSVSMGQDPLYYKVALLRLHSSCESAARAILAVIDNDPRYTNYGNSTVDPYRVRYEMEKPVYSPIGEIMVAVNRSIPADQVYDAQNQLTMIFVRGTSNCWAETVPVNSTPYRDPEIYVMVTLKVAGTCVAAADAISDVIRNETRYTLYSDTRVEPF